MALVCGVGINDCSGWAYKKNRERLEYRIYAMWTMMINRCYNPKIHEKHPTYKGCSVCERWLTLSNFAKDVKKLLGYDEWFNNPNARFMLDKDSLVPNNKIYSPETCCFLSISESAKEMIRRVGCPFLKPEIVEKKRAAKIKAVICTFPDGSEKRYSSMIEAARERGIRKEHVSNLCRGVRKTIYGYKFRFA